MSNCCKENTHRVVIRNRNITELEQEVLATSLSTYGYIDEQVKSIMSTIKWQLQLNSYIFKGDESQHVLLSASIDECNKLSNILNRNGIKSYIENVKFLK